MDGLDAVEPKQREERGTRYPGYTLAQAVEFLRQVKAGVGLSKSGREDVASAMGFTSLNGRSNRAIGALTHFGLMDRSGMSALEVTDLGRRILMPRNDEEYRAALVESVMQPTLYQRLFTRFAGHGLPSLLPNILVRDFGVNANVSEDAAKYFRESAEFAGLLRRGVLHQDVEPASTSQAEVSAEQASGATGPENTDAGLETDASSSTSGARGAQPPGANTQRYTIPLDNQGRLAAIEIPIPVIGRDLRRIEKWAQFMLAMESDE